MPLKNSATLGGSTTEGNTQLLGTETSKHDVEDGLAAAAGQQTRVQAAIFTLLLALDN